jgi:Leucine-rich repeat (LRR) protein
MVLVNLKYLNAENAGISNLPNSIGQLRNLRYLNLYACEGINTIPQSFAQLTNLEYLNLAVLTFLDSMPDIFANMVNLKELILYETPINVFYPSIYNLTNL